jgi:hypothetical protein
MARATAFKQSDLTRALKGAAAAGVIVRRAEIDPKTGKIAIFTNSQLTDEADGDLDRELQEFEKNNG